LLELGTIVAERYLVEAVVAVGGMATVYKVQHVDLGTTHALKMLLHQADSLSERLLLEGQIQARIGHPNVVSVTDVLRIEGKIGLLMEFIDARSMLDLCQRKGAMSVDEVLRLMSPVLDCVHTAHKSGILHRDLKPANILLRTNGLELEPLVTDFGIARVRSEDFKAEHTADGVVMGSPGYMAPEQFLDPNDVDFRTDIFSLGTIVRDAGRCAGLQRKRRQFTAVEYAYRNGHSLA
jgi:serine/threonine-protein kinase